jgi:thioredoxin 1
MPPDPRRDPLPMESTLTALTDATFEEEINSSDQPVLVDFWAEWCGPCKLIAPILEELATEYDGKLRIVKVDVDESPDVARRYEIMSIPTLVVFHDGVSKKRMIGAKGKGQLVQELAEFL